MFNLSYFPLPIPRQADLSTAIDSWLRRLLILLISAYQRYLSPHKGYSCAHRLLHGGESCSCHVKNALTETDLLTAIRPIQNPLCRLCRSRRNPSGSGKFRG